MRSDCLHDLRRRALLRQFLRDLCDAEFQPLIHFTSRAVLYQRHLSWPYRSLPGAITRTWER